VSLVIELLATAGDAPGYAGGVVPFVAVLMAASLSDAYRHSLSDLTHVAQRGLCSSHLMRRPLHVRQPVVVLKPLAREGRGFRGLGTPDDVTGMSAKAAHTSPRGRSLVSERDTQMG